MDQTEIDRMRREIERLKKLVEQCHDYEREQVGRCRTRYTCKKCGKVKEIDSGD